MNADGMNRHAVDGVWSVARFVAFGLLIVALAATANRLWFTDVPSTLPPPMRYDPSLASQRIAFPLRIVERQSYTFEFRYLRDAGRSSTASRLAGNVAVDAPITDCPVEGRRAGVSIPVRLIVIGERATEVFYSCAQDTYSWGADYVSRRIVDVPLMPGDYRVVLEQTGPSPLPAGQAVQFAVRPAHRPK